MATTKCNRLTTFNTKQKDVKNRSCSTYLHALKAAIRIRNEFAFHDLPAKKYFLGPGGNALKCTIDLISIISRFVAAFLLTGACLEQVNRHVICCNSGYYHSASSST